MPPNRRYVLVRAYLPGIRAEGVGKDRDCSRLFRVGRSIENWQSSKTGPFRNGSPFTSRTRGKWLKTNQTCSKPCESSDWSSAIEGPTPNQPKIAARLSVLRLRSTL